MNTASNRHELVARHVYPKLKHSVLLIGQARNKEDFRGQYCANAQNTHIQYCTNTFSPPERIAQVHPVTLPPPPLLKK